MGKRKAARRTRIKVTKNPFTMGCAWLAKTIWGTLKVRPAWLLVLAGVCGTVAYAKGLEHVVDIFAFILVEGFLHHSVGYLSGE